MGTLRYLLFNVQEPTWHMKHSWSILNCSVQMLFKADVESTIWENKNWMTLILKYYITALPLLIGTYNFSDLLMKWREKNEMVSITKLALYLTRKVNSDS